MVVFVVACAVFPLHETALLDAHYMFALPGNPSDESYDDNLPNCPYPFVIGLGSVPATYEKLTDGSSKTFNVAVSEYVRDGLKLSMVQCLFDGLYLRWTNMLPPNVGSIVQFLGTCHDVTPVATAGPLDTSLPGKRRKFQAIATPTPIPSSSLTVKDVALCSSEDAAGSSSVVLPLTELAVVPVPVGHTSSAAHAESEGGNAMGAIGNEGLLLPILDEVDEVSAKQIFYRTQRPA